MGKNTAKQAQFSDEQAKAASEQLAAKATAAEQKKIALIESDVRTMAETIANGIGAIKKAESTLEDTLTKQLDAAKKHGLTAAMLYKGTKDAPSLMWNVFTETLDNLCKISTATRDNYLSRIRKYVDGKSSTLDLFDRKGQEAARKAREARHNNASAPVVTDAAAVTERESGSPKNKAVQRGVEENLIGLPAFHRFTVAWLEANPVGAVAGTYRDMIVDLNRAIAEVLATASKGKAK